MPRDNRPELLIGETDHTFSSKFFINRTLDPIEENEPLTDENIEVKFCGENNLADTYFGWGIVRMLVNAGEQAVMIFKRGQKFKLPEANDEIPE